MSIRYRYMIVILVLVLSGCTDYDLELESYQSKITVDGWIEQDNYATVFLTLSAPYTGSVDSATIYDYALTGAKVTVFTDTESEILTLMRNDEYFPPYFYRSLDLKGVAGKTYQVKIEYGGQVCTATTTIPPVTLVDSAWFELDEDNDSLGFVWVKFNDDATAKNYYRTLTRVKGKDAKFIPNYFANYDDKYFNGQEVKMALYKGNTTALEKEDEINYTLGDTIALKFCAVDEASYNFWYTFNRELMNTGNPFASTNARVKSNVQNGLGVWCGYAVDHTLIIAK